MSGGIRRGWDKRLSEKALDHGSQIRVNAVHPGVTLSSQAIRDALAEGTDLHQRFVDRVPMRRAGDPADVAATVAFLASSDARYLNGVHIPVDGGLTASNGQTDLYRIQSYGEIKIPYTPLRKWFAVSPPTGAGRVVASP
nr:SDR family oxidoreductase [Kibdelosporangium sp. MJ126-NF4]CEL15561.1 Short-chain dehydrogenase/reductase SDR [Kibdelosporangium sp. MJ126-NF4]CTQ98226.1 Short-chain dehydrogenase/reductase SDR [Kibdelosporangium sp. MJ126-NF4]